VCVCVCVSGLLPEAIRSKRDALVEAGGTRIQSATEETGRQR